MFSCQLDSDAHLKILEVRHAEALFALVDGNREYLREWMGWVDRFSDVEVCRTFIESHLKQFSSGAAFLAGIWFKGQLAGIFTASFSRISKDHQIASIGFWLGEQFQGHGLVTKTCQAFVRHAFIELGLHRIEMRCAAENAKSRAVAAKLNFKEEGTIREGEFLHDHFVDHVVYGLLAKE